jgi:hypothetical protein
MLPTSAEARSWHHVGITFRPHEIKLYLDGEQREHTLAACGAFGQLAGSLLIGCSDESGHQSLDGAVDELIVCSRPLTAAEMKAVFLATGPAADERGDTNDSRRPSELTGVPGTEQPPTWSEPLGRAGLAAGIDEYVRLATAPDGPTSAAQGTDRVRFQARGANTNARTWAAWFWLPASEAGSSPIRLQVFDGEELAGEDRFALQVYPRPSQPIAAEPLALLDRPEGRTSAALQAARVPCRLIKSAADLAGVRRLVIGEGALAGVGPILQDWERSGRLADGVNLLVLAQRPQALLGLVFEPVYERYVWPRDPAHPVIAGLQPEELANWRGASQLVRADPPPDPATKGAPHYPGLKWHWSNRGIVTTYPFRKPTYGNFRVLAGDGFDLVHTPLLEWCEGSSRLLLCQLDLIDRAGTDPVATELLRRLCTDLRRETPRTWKRVGYFGAAGGRDFLAPHHIDFCADARNDLTNVDIAVSAGNGFDPTLAQQFLTHGGTLVLMNPGVAELQKLGLAARQAQVWRALPPATAWPLLAGVSPADLYWREPRSVTVLSDLPAGSRATQPAVIAELPREAGRLVVCTLNPSAYDDWLTTYENPRSGKPRAYYAKTSNQDKLRRTLSTLLTNLGVRQRHPGLQFYTPGKPPALLGQAPSANGYSPYLENLSDYDVNAFHNW